MEVSLNQQPLPLCHGGPAMRGETKESWMRFCEQAAIEQDPDKLLKLVKEINRMLEEKEIRLTQRAERGE